MNTSELRRVCKMFIGSNCDIKKYYDGVLVSVFRDNTLVYEEHFKTDDHVSLGDLDNVKKALLS